MRRASDRAAALALLGLCLAPAPAFAHQAGLSRGVYKVSDDAAIHLDLTLARPDVAAALGVRDTDLATVAGLGALTSALEARFVETTHVRSDGAPCKGSLASAEPDEPDGVRLDVRFECPSPSSAAPTAELRIDVGFLEALGPGHRHIARVEGGAQPVEEILFGGKSEFAATVPAVRRSTSSTSALGAAFLATTRGLVTPLFAFLVALVPRRTRDALIALAVTSLGFALGALAAARGVAPAGTALTALAALAVIYVGAENVLDPSRRWRPLVGASFGLVLGAHAGVPLGAILGGLGPLVASGALALALGLAARRLSRPSDAVPRGLRVLSGLGALAGAALLVDALVRRR